MSLVISNLVPDLFEADLIQKSLLPWYDKNQRLLPWRALPGEAPNPYYVWLSEIMLQQTTVPTVIPYFLKFIHLWPRVENLASASLDDILHAWQGLGYYARARNLFKCAQKITSLYNGVFPPCESMLLTLPGIGPYTAAAISAIAFNQSSTPVDGNIERVFSRLYAVDVPLPRSKPLLHTLARHHTPFYRGGDYAQALMDLGSKICTPRKPSCVLCPLKNFCKAYKQGLSEGYPQKMPSTLKPTRYLNAYWVENELGAVLLEKRSPSGLLGGLVMVPIPSLNKGDFFQASENLSLHSLKGYVSHTFTHFHLKITILKTSILQEDLPLKTHQFWCSMSDLHLQALPTLMKKIVKHTTSFT